MRRTWKELVDGRWEGYRFVTGTFLPFAAAFLLTHRQAFIWVSCDAEGIAFQYFPSRNEANSFTLAVESVILTHSSCVEIRLNCHDMPDVHHGVFAQQLRKDPDVPITQVDGTPRPSPLSSSLPAGNDAYQRA